MAEIVKNATISNPAFWVCLAVTIGLLVAGFCVPPQGEIHGSTLTGASILFAFATLETVHVAIKKGVDAKLTHGKTSLTVGDMNDTKPQDDETDTEETLQV